jgi:hypothetical protein
MKVSGIKNVIKIAYNGKKQPIMIWGGPGVAKSSSVRQAAEDLEVDFIDLRLSLLESVDLRGIPVPDAKSNSVKWMVPSFLPRKGKGILFIDEIVQGTPSTQAAASQLILDRKVGEYSLPEGWMVVAAGNRMTDRAATSPMPKHIANRFVHIYVDVDNDEWISWAIESGIDPRVIAFLKFRPGLLHVFDPSAKGEAFCSPRSWEFASNMLAGGIPDASILLDIMKGTVGEAAGTEFVSFLRMFEALPDVEEIIDDPHGATIPSEPSVLFAITTALSFEADKGNIAAIVTYFNRISDIGRPEFSMRAIDEITRRDPALCKTVAFIDWATKHNSMIIG